jgi:hypothetical protein
MSVLDRPIVPVPPAVPGVRWDDRDAPTVTLPRTDEPTGRHARRDPRPERSQPVGRSHSIPAGPWPPHSVPAPRAAAPHLPPAGLAVAPAPSSWHARLAEAAGPAALDQIPGPVRRHPNLAAGALIGFVVLALVLIVSAATPSTIDVNGSLLHVDSSSPLRAGTSCHTALLDTGTPVQITDSTGAVLASGTLDTGIAMIDSGSAYGREGYATSCAFSFTVTGVPAGRSSYGIEVNGVPNRLVFSEQELRDGPGLHNGS